MSANSSVTRTLLFALCLLVGSPLSTFPSVVQAQEEVPSQDLGLKVTVGGSEDFIASGLEGFVGVSDRFSFLALGERWGRTYNLFPGPLASEPQPYAPIDAAGWSVGGGIRGIIIASPKTFVSATGGIHRYASGDVPEQAPFFGLGVGQTWTFLNHLELGWEAKVRRVSSYQKERYFPLDGEVRETTMERKHLYALVFSVGGVL